MSAVAERVDARDRGPGLPDVVFPDAYLHQAPRSPRALAAGAAWFVHGGPDAHGDSPLMARLREMTTERRGLLFRLMLLALDNRAYRYAIDRMGVATPLAAEPVLAIARIAFGSVLRPEHAQPGVPGLYDVIAPVYEFFHQFNTGLVPAFAPGEFVAFGPLPFGLVPSGRLAADAPLVPNDAIGREGVATHIVDLLRRRRRSGARVLAVGDGPALTSLRIARLARDAGLTDLEITVLEPSAGQIANGRRAWALDPVPGASVRWVQGSGADARFPDATFDAAFSTYVVGAMGSDAVAAAYANATLRALVPGGEHVVLDFFDRRDDPDGPAPGPDQRQARASARLMGALSDPQLAQSYIGIWGHQVRLNQVVDQASVDAGASFTRSHRQTRYAHVPLVRFGGRTLTFSFAGYNERTAVYTRPAAGGP